MKPRALWVTALAVVLACGSASTAYALCDIQIGGSAYSAPPGGGRVDIRVWTYDQYPLTYNPCDTYLPEYRLSSEPFGIVPPTWATTVSFTRDPLDLYLWHWIVEVQPNTTGALRTGYANYRFLSNNPPGQTGGTWHS